MSPSRARTTVDAFTNDYGAMNPSAVTESVCSTDSALPSTPSDEHGYDADSESTPPSSTATEAYTPARHPQSLCKIKLVYYYVPSALDPPGSTEQTPLLSTVCTKHTSPPTTQSPPTTTTLSPHRCGLAKGFLHSDLSDDRHRRCDLESLDKRQRVAAAQGHPWMVTRVLWWALRPKIRTQYEPMGWLERLIVRVVFVLFLGLLGAGLWGIFGGSVKGCWGGGDVVGLIARVFFKGALSPVLVLARSRDGALGLHRSVV